MPDDMSDTENTVRLREAVTRLREENIQLKRRLSTLDEAQQIHRFAFESSPDAIAYLDGGLRFLACNDAERRQWGNLVGRHLQEVIDARRFSRLRPHIDRVLSGEEVVYEECGDRTQDRGSYSEVYYLPHLGEGGKVRGFCRVTRAVETQAGSSDASPPPITHDLLTELPNRILFQDRLNQAIYRAIRGKSKIGLLLVGVNSTSPTGLALRDDTEESLHRIIASRLQQCVRRSDTLARISADEFVALVENLKNPRDLQRLSQKLIDTLGQPLRGKQARIDVDICIGISIYPEHGADSTTLISRALEALQQARNRGSGRYVIHASL